MARVVYAIDEIAGTSSITATSSGWQGTCAFRTAGGTATPRSDANGFGGSYLIAGNTGGESCISPAIPVPTRHVYLKAGFYATSTGNLSEGQLQCYDALAASQIRFDLSRGNAVEVLVGGVLLGTGTAALPVNRWVLFEAEVLIDGTAGYIKVWIDGSLDFDSGATSIVANDLTNFGFNTTGNTFTGNEAWDDIGVNTITLRYDGGTGGTPATLGTLTSAGGTTALIMGFEGDATSGVLTIAAPSGSFVDGEVITDTGTFSASVDAPTAAFVGGLEPNSGRMLNEYITAVKPNADVAGQINLTPTGSANNFDNVNDVPPNTATFNTASVAGDYDLYATDASTALDASMNISSVFTAVQWQSSLTGINGGEMLIATSTPTIYSTERYALPSSSVVNVYGWEVRPDTGAAWDYASLTADLLYIGVRLVL